MFKSNSKDKQIAELRKQVEILELEKKIEELKREIEDMKGGLRREIWIGGEGYPYSYRIDYDSNDFCSG